MYTDFSIGKTALNARRTVFPVWRVGPPRSQLSTCQRTDTPSPVFNLVEAKKSPPPAEDPNESRQ